MTDSPVAALLLDRLHAAGLSDVLSVEPVEGGMAALAGVATRRSGPPLFVKSFADMPPNAHDLFAAEAEGLNVLRERGALDTPQVVLATQQVLVLSVLQPQPAHEAFWEQLAHALARLHNSTVHGRFGWNRDNWLGRYRQHNAWSDDGYEFFAERRLLRWLPERRVQAALDRQDRRALERLCARLPDILPPRSACLTHGDLWAHNVLAAEDGRPALIDPAVSYMWAEVDLAHLWCSPHPPQAERFFAVYAELTGLEDDWRARMPLIQLRQHLAVIAQFDHDWGAAEQVRATLKPFR
ncbi:MAG TPA: fructosamine kinase family protein [Actinocrinis sp.]|nr:fructosamine kinase family protein [Actinocrinis sp.]